MTATRLLTPLTTLFTALASLTAQAAPSALHQLLEEASHLKRSGVIPALVMDLDETVISSASRRAASYRAAAAEICGEGGIDEENSICAKFTHLSAAAIRSLANEYSFTELIARLQVPRTSLAESLEARMFAIYSSGYALELDQPISGADVFVREFRKRGGRIFFVSSRNTEPQMDGTLRNLSQIGLIDAFVQTKDVLLRPKGMGSLAFKEASFAKIHAEESAELQIIGIFENEPENMNALLKTFPRAQGVFVEKACILPGDLGTNDRGPPITLYDYLEK